MNYIHTHRITIIFLFALFLVVFSLGVGVLFAQSTTNTGPIIALGDSLVVGVGGTSGNGFVNILSRNINRPIINAGVSNDTTVSALARINTITAQHPALVLVFLGGNDILQNVLQTTTISNLFSIIIALEQSGAQVILIGIDNQNIPSSYASSYANLAVQTGITYIPGVLQGVIGNSQLTIDSIHPNDAGYALIASRILPVLQTKVSNLPSNGLNQTLTVTCRASNTSDTIGNSVTWVSTPMGGNGTYTYAWSGSNNLTGSNQTTSIIYQNEGTQNASVVVNSNGQSATTQCTPIDIQQPKLTAWCSVSASTNSSSPTNYTVQWNSSLFSSVATTTTYNWSGTEGLTSNNSSISKTYTSGGLKQGNVSITSGTQVLPLACTADITIVQSNPSQFLSASCQPSVNGMTVQWNTSASGSNTVTYLWSGSDNLSTTSPNFTQTYTTEGTKNATVLVTSGNQSMTLSCQARVASTTPNNGHCFIATAAYGTPLEPEVQVLRNFRDETLMHSNNGKIFVKAYYSVSPPIADFIRNNNSLKAIVRAGLEPIVKGLEVVGYKE